MQGKRTPSTICWNCQKACGDCCWSDHWQHTPVPGWTAMEVEMKTNGGKEKTFIVLDCPEFVQETRDRRKN